jgi:chromosome segregation ATPase
MPTYSAIFEIELILNELNKLMPADITNTIRGLSAGIDTIKKLAELAKKSQNVELREGILELKEQLLNAKEAVLEVKQELSAYKEENIELKQELENFQIPNIAVSQASASNITGTWERLQRDEVTNPNYVRITHNTTTNVITGRIFDTKTAHGFCLQGFYLPSSRRVSFIRRKTVDCTSPAMQYYEGWVYPGGETMGLTYHVWDYSGSSFPLPEIGVDFPIGLRKVSETP